MKSKEELNALKKEVETLKAKLAELTEEELAEVSGGVIPPFRENPRVIESDAIEPVVRWGTYDVSQEEKPL